jgi:dolichol-phosphate mannosyltransferase
VASRVIVILPAYNEEANIASLLRRILRSLTEAESSFSVIVVDDGSSDGTARILDGLRVELPLTVERHVHNQGLGATLRDGLRLASDSAEGGDVIVTMDADESHDPDLMLRMVRMIHQGYDVVVASRYQPGSRVVGLNLSRRIVSFAASRLMRVLFPTPGLRDYTCGYRAYSAAALHQAYACYGQDFVNQEGFQCMVDVLLKLRRLGLKFGEVPMTLRYDLKLGKSKMRIFKTAAGTLRLIWLRRRDR